MATDHYAPSPRSRYPEDAVCRHCGQRQAQHWSDDVCFSMDELWERLQTRNLLPRPDARLRGTGQ
jgi:hypothetical protein